MGKYWKRASFNHDFVVGLNRTGKSCRLRWVNYLHPGLKRGKMTAQEERFVLELHAKWGNRWSRIARKIPGRTDNEIKNYWRTHMRKKAQERKKAIPPPESPSSPKGSSSSSTITTHDTLPFSDAGNSSFYDTGGDDMMALAEKKDEEIHDEKGYSMDEIWKDIDLSEENTIKPVSDTYIEEGCNFSYPLVASPLWEDCWDSLWKMDEEGSKMLLPTNQFPSFQDHGREL